MSADKRLQWPWCWAPAECTDHDSATWFATRHQSIECGWEPVKPVQGLDAWVARMRASRAHEAGMLAELEALREANAALARADALREAAWLLDARTRLDEQRAAVRSVVERVERLATDFLTAVSS